jgi:hypothetical protein
MIEYFRHTKQTHGKRGNPNALKKIDNAKDDLASLPHHVVLLTKFLSGLKRWSIGSQNTVRRREGCCWSF